MKKLLSVLMAAITLLMTGCSGSKRYTVETPNRIEIIEYRQGPRKVIAVSDVSFSNPDMRKVERAFGKSLKTIVQNEFSNNNFTVLARSELLDVMNEYYFNKEIIGMKVGHAFEPSEYTVNVKIINIGLGDSGVIIPLLFNHLNHYVEISTEVTIINNRTGEIIGSSGTGYVSYTTTNFLILIGDLNSSYSIPLENALKLSIRDAILKSKI